MHYNPVTTAYRKNSGSNTRARRSPAEDVTNGIWKLLMHAKWTSERAYTFSGHGIGSDGYRRCRTKVAMLYLHYLHYRIISTTSYCLIYIATDTGIRDQSPGPNLQGNPYYLGSNSPYGAKPRHLGSNSQVGPARPCHLGSNSPDGPARPCHLGSNSPDGPARPCRLGSNSPDGAAKPCHLGSNSDGPARLCHLGSNSPSGTAGSVWGPTPYGPARPFHVASNSPDGPCRLGSNSSGGPARPCHMGSNSAIWGPTPHVTPPRHVIWDLIPQVAHQAWPYGVQLSRSPRQLESNSPDVIRFPKGSLGVSIQTSIEHVVVALQI